jgi:UDP-N-acetylmuramate--alanine ligase
MEVYAAGEEPVTGADSRSLCRSIRQRGRVDPVYIESNEQVADVLRDILRPGDLLLTQGAGNITALAHELASLSLSHD